MIRAAVARSAARAFRTSAVAKQAVAKEPLPQRLVSGVKNRLVDPVIYYSRVLLEVTLLSSKHQTMNPLALPGQFSEAFGALKNFFGSFQNGTWRNVKLAEVRTMAARGVEVLGFFTIGEMIGRKNIIGYKVEGSRVSSGHH